jgi:hypothetical protein
MEALFSVVRVVSVSYLRVNVLRCKFPSFAIKLTVFAVYCWAIIYVTLVPLSPFPTAPRDQPAYLRTPSSVGIFKTFHPENPPFCDFNS